MSLCVFYNVCAAQNNCVSESTIVLLHCCLCFFIVMLYNQYIADCISCFSAAEHDIRRTCVHSSFVCSIPHEQGVYCLSVAWGNIVSNIYER